MDSHLEVSTATVGSRGTTADGQCWEGLIEHEGSIPFTPNSSASETTIELPLSWNVTDSAVSFGASGKPKPGGGMAKDGVIVSSRVSRETENILRRVVCTIVGLNAGKSRKAAG